MTYRIRQVESEQDAEAMVAADSHQALSDRIERMVTAGRGMVLAVREFTYTGRPAVLYAGLRLNTDAHGGGFKAARRDDDVLCEARLTNGGSGYDDSRWFGYSVRCYRYSGNESEAVAWQRYIDSPDGGDDRLARRRNMTHVAFTGGLPGWKWQNTDRIVITDYSDDGVASEFVLGFEPGEGSWL